MILPPVHLSPSFCISQTITRPLIVLSLFSPVHLVHLDVASSTSFFSSFSTFPMRFPSCSYVRISAVCERSTFFQRPTEGLGCPNSTAADRVGMIRRQRYCAASFISRVYHTLFAGRQSMRQVLSVGF